MTTLAKLKTMSDVQIQSWLLKVEKEGVDTLVIALLGAEDAVKNCVFRNMSPNAVIHLKKYLEKYQARNVEERTILLNASKLERLM